MATATKSKPRTKPAAKQSQQIDVPENEDLGGVSNLTPLGSIEGQVVEVPIDQIIPHDANRKIEDESVRELSQSIKELGQLEPAHVRSIGKKFQLLSGERRFRATKLAGLKTLRCIVVKDSETLGLVRLAAANSNRENVNPIDRAHLMVQLMKPPKDGGSGLSRIDAGKAVGLMSESGAKNALRFLKLPESIQALVRNGKLSERQARRLIPFCNLTAVMNEIADELADSDSEIFYELTLEEGLPWTIKRAIEDKTRPMDDRKFTGHLVKNHWSTYPKLFEGDQGLHVIELSIDDEVWKLTTETDKWDNLQRPFVEAKAKGKDAPTVKTKDVDGKAIKLTPTEQKKIDAEKRKAANDRLNKWTQQVFVRCALRAQMAMRVPDQYRLLLPTLIAMAESDFRELLSAAIAESGSTQKASRYPFPPESSAYNSAAEALFEKLWCVLCWPVSDKADPKKTPRNLAPKGMLPDLDNLARSMWEIESLAERAGATLNDFWTASRTNGPQQELVFVWLERHTIDQLGELWKEWGKGLADDIPTKRSDIVFALMQSHRSGKLPMPKRLAVKR